jgi:uncharacterized protein YutE (UPF0331/DUF86 family)
MIDKARVATIVADLEKHLAQLAGLRKQAEDTWSDERDFLACSMALFAAFSRAFDLADEISTGAKLGTAATYRESVDILEGARAIDKELAREMRRIAFYRNLVAHEYYQITQEKLAEMVWAAGHLPAFVSACKKFIQRQGQG